MEALTPPFRLGGEGYAGAYYVDAGYKTRVDLAEAPRLMIKQVARYAATLSDLVEIADCRGRKLKFLRMRRAGVQRRRRERDFAWELQERQ